MARYVCIYLLRNLLVQMVISFGIYVFVIGSFWAAVALLASTCIEFYSLMGYWLAKLVLFSFFVL